jgi:tetratricopeptide (TPR) repeat protein
MKIHARLNLNLAMGLAIGLGQSSTVPARRHLDQIWFEASVPQARNAISGTVYGESHRPIADINVELFDDFNSPLSRVKTNASGRFTFGGLANGRFKVKALPYGTDYLEQTEEVILASVSVVAGRGSDHQNIDIYLRLNENANMGPFAAAPGVIFVQDVPPAARKLYEYGVRFLRDKKEKEGFDSLRKSIELFPNYYSALDRLGAEYAIRGTSDRSYLEAGLILLTKAVEVNPRGINSLFGLGWTQYQLGLNAGAIETLTRATTIYGKAPDAYLWLGRALRRASMLDRAEAAFKRANDLTNGKVADTHWQMAGLYRDQKRYREAADELELFLKMEPKAADAEKIRVLIKQLREKPGTD